jgi:hypothetical protein
MLEHPGRATSWVRAATTFILPETADVPIYRRWGGGMGAPRLSDQSDRVFILGVETSSRQDDN